MSEDLKKKLKDLPKEPGVYFHKNKSGEIIYVGKAAKLNNRVRQYFQKSRARDPKTEALVSEIHDTEWMVVGSELEALFLEAEMIRRYMPQYNILLRDDKSLSYIRINYDDDYPTVTMTRNPLDDGARYFGPYLSSGSVKQALKFLRKVFPYATKKMPSQKRATLHYHIGLDPGLEEGKTSLKEYRANLRKLISVIEGKRKDVIKELEKEMRQASESQQFESAARLRNQIAHLKNLDKQIIFSDKEFMDISKDHALSELAELLNLYEPDKSQNMHADGVQGEDENRTEAYRSYKEGESEASTKQSTATSSGATGSAGEQRRRLRNLRRIEGYDVSHQQGTDVVASMVVFTNGVSNKGEYRKFKTKKDFNNDFYNMNETIRRRFGEKNANVWGLPDLVLIDGGKGQLDAAIKARDEQSKTTPFIGLAKRDEQIIIKVDGSNIEYSEEALKKLKGYAEISKDFVSLSIPHNSHLIKLLQRIRDESHRFAVSYHSTLKVKRQTASILDEVPGIGPATRKKLIKKFGSLRNVIDAPVAELEEILGAKKAKHVKQLATKNPINSVSKLDGRRKKM